MDLIKWRDVEGMLVDQERNLWITGNTLVRYSTSLNKVKNFSFGSLNGIYSYKAGSYHKGNSGTLYFGGNNVIVYFNPRQIIDNSFSAHPNISEI